MKDLDKKTIIHSTNKLFTAYARLGGMVESNLKLLEIARKLKDSCEVKLTKEQKHKLDELCLKIENSDPIVVKARKEEVMKPSSGYGIVGGISDADKFNVTYFKPPLPNMSIAEIHEIISNEGAMKGLSRTTVNEMRKGTYLKMVGAGRLTIVVDHNIARIRILNVLGLDVTNSYDIQIVGEKFVIISKNILTSGDMYLKFV